MGVLEIIIIVIAAAIVLAVLIGSIYRKVTGKPGGCCGDCSHCKCCNVKGTEQNELGARSKERK